MQFRSLTLPLALLLVPALMRCGGSDSSSSTTEAASSSDASQSEPSGTVDQTVTLQRRGNQMKYRQTNFTVAPGQTIKLVFENTATSPSIQHNVVILTSNDEALFREVGEAGTRAGSTNDYVPQEGPLREQVLAYTPMSQPGETVEVTFTAPEETGEHGYVCNFPGHWATMQGTMHVKKASA